ncbi:MAG: DUF3991 domain-containing protein [Anaerorhabdus sp.]|uniref:DUF3991 domain-containing protein n=1 Tax=Anaerorhabdus sp. TaxID=1872524 RepID=UPI002FC9D0E3
MSDYKKYSREDYDLVNQVNIADFLRDCGENITKKGKDYRWDKHSSLTMRDNRWFWFKTGEGGYPLKFLTEFMDYRFKDAMDTLLDYANTQGYTIEGRKHDVEEKKEFSLPSKNETMSRCYGYLCKTRFIDKSVVDEFVKLGMIYEDKQYHNVVFVGYDNQGVPVHAHKKSTVATQGQSYRGNVEGSNPNYSFHYKGSSNQLYVFEAPIDLLSYITLHPKHWKEHSYLALCGVSTLAIPTMLGDNTQLDICHICTDSDSAGFECFEKIKDTLSENTRIHIDYLHAKNKDFNEDLREKHGLEPKPAELSLNQLILENCIEKIQDTIRNDFDEYTFKDLYQVYADLYMKFDEKIDLQKLQDEAILITGMSLILYNQVQTTEEVKLESIYKQYKNKGSVSKKMERLKKQLQQVRILMGETEASSKLADAYLDVARESFNLCVDCEKEIFLLEQENRQSDQEQKHTHEMCLVGY